MVFPNLIVNNLTAATMTDDNTDGETCTCPTSLGQLPPVPTLDWNHITAAHGLKSCPRSLPHDNTNTPTLHRHDRVKADIERDVRKSA